MGQTNIEADVLNIDFYKKYYSDVSHLDADEIIKHWENRGEAEGRFANPEQVMRHLLQTSDLPQDFDAYAYIKLNADVADSIKWPFEAIVHYLTYGHGEERRFSFDEIPDQISLKFEDTNIDSSQMLSPVEISSLTDPVYRMISKENRDTWIFHAEKIISNRTFSEILEIHPRGKLGNIPFSLVKYFTLNHDIFVELKGNTSLSLFHYLEFGIEEMRSGHVTMFDRDFVELYYGIDLTHATTLTDVVILIDSKTGKNDGLYFFSEIEFAQYIGIKSEKLLQYFDHEFYRATARDFDRPGATRWDCLTHFMETGRFVPNDISYNLIFDQFYYYNEYVINREQTSTQVDPNFAPDFKRKMFNQWIDSGMDAGDSPSLRATVSKRVGVEISDRFPLILRTYAINASLNTSSMNEIFSHFMTEGNDALFKIDIPDISTAVVVMAVADRYVFNGKNSVADILYQHILHAFPSYAPALQHQSDLLDRNQWSGAAIGHRERLIRENRFNKWTFLTLANSYAKLGQYANAAVTLAKGSAQFPVDNSIRIQRREMESRAFHALWDIAPQLALLTGYEEAQEQIRKSIERCTERKTSVARAGRIKRVAIVGNEDIVQCRLYRITQKVVQIEAAGFNVKTFNYTSNLQDYIENIGQFDAVIFYRVPGFPSVVDAITRSNDFGIPTFYDIDDLVFDRGSFPPSLDSYAGTITAELHASIACGVPLFEHAMSLCDYGIASTSALVPLMAERVKTGKAYLHRNALGAEHLAAISAAGPTRLTTDPCRILYASGTRAHKEDFYDILEPALIRMVEKYGDKVQIILIGYFSWNERLKSVAKNVTLLEPIWDLELFWQVLSQVDINVSVLSPSLVNDCKSEIKWMEAAMLGVPSVVSATHTHREVIEHGATGFLCETADDFAASLDRLIADPALRTSIGTAARTRVTDLYSIAALSKNMTAIFNDIPVLKKKRLLIVNVFYPPQAIGGATRVVHDNVTDLIAQFGDEFSIDVVCTLEGGLKPFEVDVYSVDGVRVFAITAPNEPDIDKNPSHPGMARVFSSCLDVIQPDLIHFHCIQRLTASIVTTALSRRIPYVITVHDGWWVSDNQFIIDKNDVARTYIFPSATDYLDNASVIHRNPRASYLQKPLFKARNVIAISKAFEAIYTRAGVPNVITIENGLSKIPSCTRKPRANGAVRLAHIGGMERHKGFHIVKYSLISNRFPNLSLLVIDATLDKGVERYETWGSTPVTFRGRTDQSEISDLYAQVDVLLAPSVWPEGYGLVAREALACGCWVVASDRGAIGDSVTHGGNGYVIDVSTLEPMVNVLGRMDRDPEVYRQPPNLRPTLRTSTEQAAELAQIYRSHIGDVIV